MSLGFLTIIINVLSMITLQLTRVLPSMTIVRTIMGILINQQVLMSLLS